MEGEKRADSSSSFTSDLFGSTDPSSASASASSSSILASIFPPNSPKVSGTESSLRSEAADKKQDSASKAWTAKRGPSVGIPQSKEDESQSQSLSKEDMSSFYEQKVQPCHLSSSIYYGGQDIYSSPQNTQSSGYSTVNKDGGEDDSGSDSRGNWWQGGVYY